jgi:hypothetical protein
MESQYRTAAHKVESIVRRNSSCRDKKNVVSCCACDDYDVCKSNDYDYYLQKKKTIARRMSSATVYKINKEIREH